MSKSVRIIAIAVLVFLLVAIRAVSSQLFYDPSK